MFLIDKKLKIFYFIAPQLTAWIQFSRDIKKIMTAKRITSTSKDISIPGAIF